MIFRPRNLKGLYDDDFTVKIEDGNFKYTYTVDFYCDHNYVWEKEKKPTCFEDGYREGCCSHCNKEIKEVLPSAGKHTYKTKVVAPTLTSKGYTKHTCSVCGNSYKDNYTAKLIDLSGFKVTIPYSSYTYRGRGIKPTVTVTDGAGKKLVKGTDFTVSYSNNTDVGTAKITVKGKGKYGGTVKKTFTVKPLSLTSSYAKVTIPYSAYTWTGSAVKPKMSVQFKDGDIIPSGQYTVTYSNNVNVGVATVTVKGKGTDVTGTVKKTFVVKPAKNQITSITAGSGSFKISWKRGTTGTVGYQVLYSKDKSFTKDVHSYTSTNLSDLSENFSKIPNSRETWYVKVRSFYTKDGDPNSTRYGNYSDVRSITTR